MEISHPRIGHPQAHFVASLCGSLAKVPGVGHERADRVQSVLLSPQHQEICNALKKVFASSIPYVGQGSALYNLGKALARHSHHSSHHTYQRTLREWLDENK